MRTKFKLRRESEKSKKILLIIALLYVRAWNDDFQIIFQMNYLFGHFKNYNPSLLVVPYSLVRKYILHSNGRVSSQSIFTFVYIQCPIRLFHFHVKSIIWGIPSGKQRSRLSYIEFLCRIDQFWEELVSKWLLSLVVWISGINRPPPT